MTDPTLFVSASVAALMALAMVTAAALAGWRGWLRLKHQELQARHAGPTADAPALPGTTARIEIADLKERIRKLEAIAAGVEL